MNTMPWVMLIAVGAVLAAACGGGGPDRFVVTNADAPFVPVVESQDLAVGVDRVVLRLLDRDAAPTFDAGTTFAVRYFEPVVGGVRFRSDATLAVVEVGAETLYVGAAPFDAAGTWELEVRASAAPGGADGEPLISARLPFVVALETTSPAVGTVAPGTPSLQVALGTPGAAGGPVLVVLTLVGDCFGSGLCDRALAQTQRLGAAAGVAVVAEQGLEEEPGEGPGPSTSGVLTDWSLENDPWIYVVGPGGVITARFERLATDAELEAALAGVERCFVGESEEASIGGEIVPHGVRAGEPIPEAVLETIERRGFDPDRLVRRVVDDRELGLFAQGASVRQRGVHDVAFIFVLVQPEGAGEPAWEVIESSLLVEVGCG